MATGVKKHEQDSAARFLHRVVTSAAPGFEGDAVWCEMAGFAVAHPTQVLIEHLTATLRGAGFDLVGQPLLVRHWPGGRDLPEVFAAAPFGFSLDLTTARRTLDGGLLLFSDHTVGVKGWRAEAGALLIWDGPHPQMTELVPGAPERVTLIGGATPAVI